MPRITGRSYAPSDLSDITPKALEGVLWNGINATEYLIYKLNELEEMGYRDDPNIGIGTDKGYWISFVEIMDSNGDWFVPTVQYAFHVFPSDDMMKWLNEEKWQGSQIYNLFKIKNIYVRVNPHLDWELVDRTKGSGPILDDDQVAQGVLKGRYGAASSEGSHIWTTVETLQGDGYVVSEWKDISSFAYRELLLRDIDPEDGELKMLIQVAVEDLRFRAAINNEVI